MDVLHLAATAGALAGYAFAFLNFRGKGALFSLVLATMMIPVQVVFLFGQRTLREGLTAGAGK